MEIEQKIPDIDEILTIVNTKIGHFPDKIAKWLFKESENLRGLVLILASELAENLNFEQTKIESSNVVDNTLRELVSDMVFTVPYQDTSIADELTIYILIEHQSNVDHMMGYRLLSYMCHIWHGQLVELQNAQVPRSQQRLRPILPIVFYTGSQRWETPLSLTSVMDVPEQIAPFVPTYDTLFLGVKDIDPDELTKTDHPFSWLMTVLQKENENEASMLETLEIALTQLDRLQKDNPELHRTALIYLSLLVMCRRHKTEQAQLLGRIRTHTHDKEVENIIMTGAEALIQQGIEQEKTQRINDKRTGILKILQHRYVDVSEAVVNEINKIDDLTHLDDLFDQALTADSLEDIDLSNNSNGK